jgi:hypothetical protein
MNVYDYGYVFASWRQRFVDGTVDAICDIFRDDKMAENEKRRLLTDLLNGKTVLETAQVGSVIEGPWRLRLRPDWVNPQGVWAPAGDSDRDAFTSDTAAECPGAAQDAFHGGRAA